MAGAQQLTFPFAGTPSAQPRAGVNWKGMLGTAGTTAARGARAYRTGQRRAQSVRSTQHAFVFGFIMDIATIALLGTGQFFWYLIAVGASILVGLYLVGWPALLSILKIYPGGAFGYLPLFTLASILGHVGVPALRTSSLGSGTQGGNVAVNVLGGRAQSGSKEGYATSYKYGLGRYAGEATAETVGNLFHWLGKLLPFLLVVGAVAYYFMFGLPAPLRAASVSQGEFLAEKWNLADRFRDIASYLNPKSALEKTAGIGDFQTRPDYLTEGIRGVAIEHFDGRKVYEGDPFTLQAEVRVDAFPHDDSTLSFGCLLKDDEKIIQTGNVQISGYPEGETTVLVPKGTKQRKYFVYCSYDALASLDVSYKNYKALLTWSYEDILTTSVLRVFTQQRAIQDRLFQQGLDPLEDVRGGDFVDTDGFAQDNCVKGCGLADLSMKLGSALPLSEGVPHYLDVALVGLSTWKGSLQRLREIQLLLPEQDLHFNEQRCLWEGGSRIEQHQQERSFVLDEDSPQLQMVNTKLPLGGPVTIAFTCTLTAEGGVDDIPTPGTLTAVARYDYGGQEPALVLVVKKEPEVSVAA